MTEFYDPNRRTGVAIPFAAGPGPGFATAPNNDISIEEIASGTSNLTSTTGTLVVVDSLVCAQYQSLILTMTSVNSASNTNNIVFVNVKCVADAANSQQAHGTTIFDQRTGLGTQSFVVPGRGAIFVDVNFSWGQRTGTGPNTVTTTWTLFGTYRAADQVRGDIIGGMLSNIIVSNLAVVAGTAQTVSLVTYGGNIDLFATSVSAVAGVWNVTAEIDRIGSTNTQAIWANDPTTEPFQQNAGILKARFFLPRRSVRLLFTSTGVGTITTLTIAVVADPDNGMY